MAVFQKILAMSLTAGLLVPVVALFRLPIRRVSKRLCLFLWIIIGLRLIFPVLWKSPAAVLPESPLSLSERLFGQDAETDALNAAAEAKYEAEALIAAAEADVKKMASGTGMEEGTAMSYAFHDPDKLWKTLFIVWIAGIAVMASYVVVSFIRVYRMTRIRVHLNHGDNACEGPRTRFNHRVYVCDGIDTPFIFGLFKPSVYLPEGLTETQISDILAHEEAHIRHLDPLWKLAAFLLLTVHWFNPLLWAGYVLFCRDMELACDESVLKHRTTDERRSYALTLLELSCKRLPAAVVPLAFSEGRVSRRIKAAASYRKVSRKVMALAILGCVLFTAGFATDRKSSETPEKISKEVVEISAKEMLKKSIEADTWVEPFTDSDTYVSPLVYWPVESVNPALASTFLYDGTGGISVDYSKDKAAVSFFLSEDFRIGMHFKDGKEIKTEVVSQEINLWVRLSAYYLRGEEVYERTVTFRKDADTAELFEIALPDGGDEIIGVKARVRMGVSQTITTGKDSRPQPGGFLGTLLDDAMAGRVKE